MAVSQGRKRPSRKRERGRRGPRASAFDSARIRPIPPTRVTAQKSSARPTTIRKGAASVSSHLIDSVPAHTKYMFTAQNSRKAR